MMKRLCLLLMLVLPLCATVRAIDPDELPLGVYCNNSKEFLLIQDIDVMAESLGVNFVYGSITSDAVEDLSQAGYDVVKWGSPDPYNPNRMSGYSYFKVEAEDRNSPIRFENWQGQPSGAFLVSSDSGNMADNLWFSQYPVMHFAGNEDPKALYAKARLAIDTAGVDLGEIIGRILVHREDSTNYWSVRGNIAITATQELLAGDTVEVPDQASAFTLCDLGSCAWSYKVKYSFWNSGATTVYLDYFKSYDEMGQEIVETTHYDSLIQAAVSGSWRDNVDYWWLRDEPRYDHFMPYGKVRGLVNDETDDLSSITAFLMTSVRASWDTVQESIALRSFLQLTGQDKVVINDYPFTGGVGTAFFTDYTGYADEVGDAYQPNTHRGLQKEMELISCELFDVVAREIQTDTVLKEFWASPQCYFQTRDSSAGYNPPNTMYFWRPPTHAEHRLNVYLPLCYHATGLALWMYHWGFSSDPSDPGHPPYSFGFYTSNTQRNEPMWDVFANDIVPYIKAIDSVYMGLTWRRAYACSSGLPINRPPYAFVDSIDAFSNGAGSNPDLGWFHVGEFDDGEDYYAMIVNRACSRGPSDSTEAPSITATITLDHNNLKLGHDMYVIDLAQAVYYDKSASEWIAFPDTTRVTFGRNENPSFIVGMRAGEGRLFKIMEAR